MKQPTRLITAILAISLFAFCAGFLLFVGAVKVQPTQNTAHADGIIVLTGGKFRVREAVQLLARGKGGRLLISGVHRHTSKRALRRLMPGHGHLFNCCIDIGYQARNTIGNAREARDWAKQHGFRSLIVVTSSYHMPRSLAEIAHHLPNTKLIPFSVVPKDFHVQKWWAYPGTARLLFSEYVKFLTAQARTRAESLLSSSRSASALAGTTTPLMAGQ